MKIPKLLDISRPPERADAIFVFAGREERKHKGVALFHDGFAPRLILSVGRFEWRRFPALGLWSDGGLAELVPTIEAPERHFFVHVEHGRAHCDHVQPGQLGTMTEAQALADVIEEASLRSVLLVSSPEHLPRCMVALRTFVSPECRLIPVASSPSNEPIGPELAKLAGYGLVALRGYLRRLE